MKFRINWRIEQDKWLPVLKKWTSMTKDERADAGDEVKIIGRWHDMSSRTGVVICETSDLAALQCYVGRWNPYMEVDIAPVLDDEESAAAGERILAESNALVEAGVP